MAYLLAYLSVNSAVTFRHTGLRLNIKLAKPERRSSSTNPAQSRNGLSGCALGQTAGSAYAVGLQSAMSEKHKLLLRELE